MQIVQNVDGEKSIIAAKCLAELGPSDLGSIALKFDTQLQTYKNVRNQLHRIFYELFTNQRNIVTNSLVDSIFDNCFPTNSSAKHSTMLLKIYASMQWKS